MYSWRTIRTLCLVLLLMPVVHFAYLLSSDVLASLDPSPDAWQDEIEAYRRADLANKLPANPIVVVGGMRVKLWQGLEDILAPQPVLMRGIGDAIVEDIIHNHGQLIAYYRPQTVIFLPGNSEFHIRDGKSATDLVFAIQRLLELEESLGANYHFYVFVPIKTPLYTRDYPKIEEVHEMLTAWAMQHPRVTILDANRLLRNAEGDPDPSYFRADGVNLNEHGYLRLSTLVQNHLEKATSAAN